MIEMLGELELNKVYCSDAIEFLKKIPDNSVDLVITSPPYNVGGNNMISYERYKRESKSKYGSIKDNLSDDDYSKWTKEILDELFRVTRKHIFYNIQMLSSNKKAILNLISDYKDYIKDIIVWVKKQVPPQIEEGVMNTQFEFIFILSKEKPEQRKFYDVNFKGNFNNVIIGNTSSQENKWSDEINAIFPIYLPRKIIQKFSNKEDNIILDPFLGSGTTALAAKQLGRKFIGCDISQEYVNIANKRLSQEILEV